MKKLISLILAATMLLVSACALAEAADAYTTASATKAVLSGDELAAAEAVLQAKSSLLSTSAEAKAEGYAAKEGTGLAQTCPSTRTAPSVSPRFRSGSMKRAR